MPLLHRSTAFLLFALLLFSPWALGTTQPWSIWTANGIGYALGVLLIAKWVSRQRGRRPEIENRESEVGSPGFAGMAGTQGAGSGPAYLTFGLAVLTILILVWCLVSALNAGATVKLDEGRLDHSEDYLSWLPHSFDAPSSWFAFWRYLGLACFFWALRDWLIADRGADIPGVAAGLSRRGERLLWLLSINGAVLALVGIVQLADGTEKLIWLFEDPVGRDRGAHFGPYGYRNNAAQYLNLIWPLALGLWWVQRHSRQVARPDSHRVGGSARMLLAPCIAVMIIGPVLSGSRGGVFVAVAASLACLIVVALSMWSRRRRQVLIAIPLVFGLVVLAGWLGWPRIAERARDAVGRLPTGCEKPLTNLTLRCVFEVPVTLGQRYAGLIGLSDGILLWGQPNSAILYLTGSGALEFRVHGATRREVMVESVPSFLEEYGGRTVEVTVSCGERSNLYIDGVHSATKRRVSPAGFEGPASYAHQFLWSNRIAGGSGKFKGSIHRIGLLDRALDEAEIAELAGDGAASAWAGLGPIIDLDLRFAPLRPSLWLADGSLGGRKPIHDSVRRMLPDYPTLFGSGPGTFAALCSMHPAGLDNLTDPYAHNDYLQTRLTFGVLGSVLVFVALAIAIVSPLFGGIIQVPLTFVVFLWISLAGCLVYAYLDFPLQIHSVLLVFLTICCLLTVVTVRESKVKRGENLKR